MGFDQALTQRFSGGFHAANILLYSMPGPDAARDGVVWNTTRTYCPAPSCMSSQPALSRASPRLPEFSVTFISWLDVIALYQTAFASLVMILAGRFLLSGRFRPAVPL